MPIPKRKVESGLVNKGFVKRNRDHKTLRYVASDGTQTSIFTHYSHGAKGQDVKDGEISAMAKQCKISTNQFKRLIDCPLTIEAYEKLLFECGALQIEPSNNPMNGAGH